MLICREKHIVLIHIVFVARGRETEFILRVHSLGKLHAFRHAEEFRSSFHFASQGLFYGLKHLDLLAFKCLLRLNQLYDFVLNLSDVVLAVEANFAQQGGSFLRKVRLYLPLTLQNLH